MPAHSMQTQCIKSPEQDWNPEPTCHRTAVLQAVVLFSFFFIRNLFFIFFLTEKNQ